MAGSDSRRQTRNQATSAMTRVAVLVLAAVIGADYVASRSPGEAREVAHSARLATA